MSVSVDTSLVWCQMWTCCLRDSHDYCRYMHQKAVSAGRAPNLSNFARLVHTSDGPFSLSFITGPRICSM